MLATNLILIDLLIRKCLALRKALLDLNKLVLSMLNIVLWVSCGGEDITDKLTLTQLPDLSPVENKEYKPGPIGKERSLKNRKVKDAQQGEPEGQEKSSPTSVRSPEPVTAKETKATSELSTEIGTMISVSAPEFGTSTKVRKMLKYYRALYIK